MSELRFAFDDYDANTANIDEILATQMGQVLNSSDTNDGEPIVSPQTDNELDQAMRTALGVDSDDADEEGDVDPTVSTTTEGTEGDNSKTEEGVYTKEDLLEIIRQEQLLMIPDED